ncbi:MAG: hypothetical protein EPN91_11990 [Salinibacterium sp.]|nr:MAG: hypothetical protein EPN91_11990 [Salinibacterium sp.]
MKNRPYIKIVITYRDGVRVDSRIKGAHVTDLMIKAVDDALYVLATGKRLRTQKARRRKP